MSGLLNALSNAMSALAASQDEVNVSSNNLANANTPGYARERVVLEEQPSFATGALSGMGNGVTVESVQSIRDPLLDASVQQETQQQSASQEIVSAMQPVQTLFVSGNGGVSDEMSTFFDGLQELSTSPTDPALQATVLSDAGNLATAFQTTATQLTGTQQSLDLGVTQSVSQINQLTTQLAQVNGQITSAQGSGQSGNNLQNQQQNLLSELSSLIGFSVGQSSDGQTITTANGTPLVVGNQSFALSTATNSSTGFQDVVSAQGEDITSQISAGQLGGMIQARDVQVAGVLSSLNTLAGSLSSAINTVNENGYYFAGATGTKGTAMFSVTPGNGAAASMSVALTSGSQIASSSSATASGDNSNLLAMIDVGTQPLVNSQTPTQMLSGIVYQVGNDVSQAQSDSAAGSLMLTQLQDEQGAVEGVSTDEEASNLLTYQQSYQAAARVVTVVDDLTLVALNLGVETAMT
jgi:flagellar hook-associated protein 1 FlgK